jgi:hypothetical protein
MKFKHECPTIEAFIDKLKELFYSFDPDILGRISALECVIFREILKDNGGNQWNIPHTGIRKRQKREKPSQGPDHSPYSTGADRRVPKVLVQNSIDFYNQHSTNGPFSWKNHPDYPKPGNSNLQQNIFIAPVGGHPQADFLDPDVGTIDGLDPYDDRSDDDDDDDDDIDD